MADYKYEVVAQAEMKSTLASGKRVRVIRTMGQQVTNYRRPAGEWAKFGAPIENETVYIDGVAPIQHVTLVGNKLGDGRRSCTLTDEGVAEYAAYEARYNSCPAVAARKAAIIASDVAKQQIAALRRAVNVQMQGRK